ncbi:hypothetical protein UNDYM_5587 [Undibacterium sp. YM2]|nr:hypothetical protein UNDYM_5587 [Undibacterium sp. YM2]
MLGMLARHELGAHQRKPHVRQLVYVALPCALLLALANYLQSGYPLPGIIVALTAVLMLGAAFFMSSHEKLLAMAESLLLLFALLASVALGLLGGIAGSGILWIYAFPFLALWLKGQRQGAQWSLVWLLAMAFSMLAGSSIFPFAYAYDEKFILQASVALLFYSAIALAYNFSRSQLEEKLYVSEQGMQAKTRDYVSKLELAAYQDGVTGLPNRLRLLDILSREIANAQERGHTLLVAHIRLKKMFETANLIGPDASDKLMRYIAATMTATVGSRVFLPASDAMNLSVSTASILKTSMPARSSGTYWPFASNTRSITTRSISITPQVLPVFPVTQVMQKPCYERRPRPCCRRNSPTRVWLFMMKAWSFNSTGSNCSLYNCMRPCTKTGSACIIRA